MSETLEMCSICAPFQTPAVGKKDWPAVTLENYNSAICRLLNFAFLCNNFSPLQRCTLLLRQGGPPLHLLCAVVTGYLQEAPEASLPPQREAAEVPSGGGEEGRCGQQAPQ